MTTRFEQIFSRTAAINLIRQFGEAITYYPGSGATSRSIDGIVERGTLQLIGETGEITGQAIVIRVRNSATEGIASTEIDTGGDEIEFPLRVGDTPRRRSVVKVINDNAGILELLCQ